MNHLSTPAFGPLSGVRTVPSGIEVAGPFTRQVFAKWSAEVTWIENATWVGTIRMQPNYPQLSRRNLYALSLNISKDEGRKVFPRPMETINIFTEASKGPAFACRGTTDEVLQEHNPKLVIAHLSGSDQLSTEEYTNPPVCNTIVQAFSGYPIQNDDMDQPMPTFPYTADYFSEMTVTTAALVAPHRVRETGKGESIDIAMYEVVLRMGQYFMMGYFNGGEVCPRVTKGKDSYHVGCDLYKCTGDCTVMGLVGVTQINEYFRDIGLAHILGTPEVPGGTQLIHRIECPYDPLVGEKLDAWLAMHTIAEVQTHFTELNIACTKVLTIPELEGNPQYVAHESITQWQTVDDRTCKGPNTMPKFKNNPGKVWCGVPSHGMDIAVILKNIGYNEADINESAGKGLTRVER